MSKHTPGPWKVEHPKERPHPVVTAADGTRVAEVQHEEDAALIAAAPDLFNLVKRAGRALDRAEASDPLCDELRAMIAKLEGK